MASRLAERLAALSDGLEADDDGYTPLGAVTGAPLDLPWLRAALPRSPLLVPGYGAQGAVAADVAPAFDARGLGALVNASRTLTYGEGFAEATTFEEVGALVRERAEAMRRDLEAAVAARATASAGG